jgi:hypothetical protein
MTFNSFKVLSFELKENHMDMSWVYALRLPAPKFGGKGSGAL